MPMVERAESDSIGRFFDFPLAGIGEELDSTDVLRTFLADTAAGDDLSGPQQGFTASIPQPLPETSILPFHHPAFPARRLEVTGESNHAAFQPSRQDAGASALEASSSGGTLGDAARIVSPSHHKERNRAAQKKFRERQKARAMSNSQRLEELERRLAQLLNEKKGLESHNKLLQHTVMLNTTHHSELEAQKQAFHIQQEVLLMDTARIYRRGLNRPDLTLEDTKQFTMAAFLSVFEHFIGRYRMLLEVGGEDPASAALSELQELVLARRLEEARIALFSKWSSATLAWNREETRSGLQPPSAAFYGQLLGTLRLSAEQQQEWLQARRRLLEQLADIRRRRQRIALSLGMLLLQRHLPDGSSAEEKQLRDSLEEEREAVLTFLYSIIDCSMLPAQEAALDTSCYPWWPCLWTLCNLLAQKQKKEPPDSLSDKDGASDVFARFSAAELLREPLLARMGGLQLKRTIVSVATPENVLAAVGAPPPRIAEMRDMTVYEVMCGKHLEAHVLSHSA